MRTTLKTHPLFRHARLLRLMCAPSMRNAMRSVTPNLLVPALPSTYHLQTSHFSCRTPELTLPKLIRVLFAANNGAQFILSVLLASNGHLLEGRIAQRASQLA
jgi:hypothetical protein